MPEVVVVEAPGPAVDAVAPPVVDPVAEPVADNPGGLGARVEAVPFRRAESALACAFDCICSAGVSPLFPAAEPVPKFIR
jgi:hypothetical protein